MIPRLHHWFQFLRPYFSAILPSSCVLCGQNGNEAICDGCHGQFFSRKPLRCVQCALPLSVGKADFATRCGHCLQHAPAFDATIVAADYIPPIDQLILTLKFGNRLALAPLFARMLRDALALRHTMDLPMQLTAVPLGPQRLAERGFNQALEIAKPLSRALGIPLAPRLVSRLRDTRAQAMLHPDERRKNIRHAFTIAAHEIDCIRGQHIGVVDDVITTGETLGELAATLKRFGAARVTNFVFARTLQR